MPSLEPIIPASGSASPSRRRRALSFLCVYLACALLFQLGGATPSWGPSSPLEAFGAGLLGMLALVTIGLAWRSVGWHRLFWVASCLALIALGLDEALELHEASGFQLASEKDHLKVLLWAGAAGSLAVVRWLERPSARAQKTMALGYALHTLYILLEVGDGGYFELGLLSPAWRGLGEELLKLAMLSAYLLAFLVIAEESAEESHLRLVGDSSDARHVA